MKLFIWDFHGTLEFGTERAVIDISNQVLQDFGYTQRFSAEDVERLYGLRWGQYFEDLLPSERVDKHRQLEVACFEMSRDNFDLVRKYIQPSFYAHEVLQAIAESSHEQVVISNTQPQSLPRFLEAVDMQRYFLEGYAFATGNHLDRLGESKEDVVRRLRGERTFEEVVAIGDSAQDVGLARLFGGRSYLYAHPWRDFKDAEADFNIKDLREILREI
jgi:phosphoglycolate phosphatase-like HAD superfamily hydrolase